MLRHNYAIVKPLLEELVSMGLLIKFNNGIQSGKNKSALYVKVLPESLDMQVVYRESCTKLILSSSSAKLSDEADAILKSNQYTNLVKEHCEAPTPVTRSAAAKSLTTIKKKQKKNSKISPNNGTNTLLRYFSRITKEINAQSETNGEVPSRQNDDCEIISCLSVDGKSNTNDLIPPIPPTNSSSSSIMKTVTSSSTCSSSSTELTSKYFCNALVPRHFPRIARLSNGNSTSLQDDKQHQISDKNEQ